jgi:two-component system response regulator
MKEPWILIVEDNADDIAMVVRALEKHRRPEYPKICFDASEALDTLNGSETVPKLVLLDGRLPGMASEVFLEKLRKTERTRFIPVVCFSGHTHSRSVLSALSSGANSYVCKPLEFDQMMDQLGLTLRYWLDVHCHPDLTTPRVQK